MPISWDAKIAQFRGPRGRFAPRVSGLKSSTARKQFLAATKRLPPEQTTEIFPPPPPSQDFHSIISITDTRAIAELERKEYGHAKPILSTKAKTLKGFEDEVLRGVDEEGSDSYKHTRGVKKLHDFVRRRLKSCHKVLPNRAVLSRGQTSRRKFSSVRAFYLLESQTGGQMIEPILFKRSDKTPAQWAEFLRKDGNDIYQGRIVAHHNHGTETRRDWKVKKLLFFNPEK